MRPEYEALEFDVLVIGAGVAGLRAALAASDRGVKTAILCKSLLGKSASVLPCAGIAAVGDDRNDSWRSHFADTVRAGAFAGDWRQAEVMAKESPERLAEMISWGALVERTSRGRVAARRAPGHSAARLAYRSDRIGLEFLRALQHQVLGRQLPVYMEFSALRLLVDEGRVHGALVLDRKTGRFIFFNCAAVVVATGDAATLWSGGAPADCTGDGMALALQAGAQLSDLEFARGGIRVQPESGATRVQGLFAAGGAAAGLHGASALEGNALAGALVFGRRAGLAATGLSRPTRKALASRIGHSAAAFTSLLGTAGPENPHSLLRELRSNMTAWAAAARTASTLRLASEHISDLRCRSRHLGVPGGTVYNSAWHAAFELDASLTVSEALLRAAAARQETRGAHVRVDFPQADDQYAQTSIVVEQGADGLLLRRERYPDMPSRLRRLFPWNRQWLEGRPRSESGEETRPAGRSGTMR